MSLQLPVPSTIALLVPNGDCERWVNAAINAVIGLARFCNLKQIVINFTDHAGTSAVIIDEHTNQFGMDPCLAIVDAWHFSSEIKQVATTMLAVAMKCAGSGEQANGAVAAAGSGQGISQPNNRQNQNGQQGRRRAADSKLSLSSS